MKPATNYIKIKSKLINDSITIAGKDFFLDPKYDKEKHASTEGVVVDVCDQLFFNKRNPRSIEYDTDIEIQVGDRAIFNYMVIKDLLFFNEYEKVGDEYFFYMRYDSFFAVIRGEEVIPVNGWVLVEPIIEYVPKVGSIEVPDYLKKKISITKGVVKYLSTPLKGYLFDTRQFGKDPDNIEVEDGVLFKWVYSRPLQYEMHASLEKQKNLYRIHRKDILAIEGSKQASTISGYYGC